jgi:hypothetical protein
MPGEAIADVGSEEVPPLAANEDLYRRLLIGGWYKAGKPVPIPQKQFMPRAWKSDDKPGDHDGLSVNRALLITAEKAAVRPDTGEKVPLAGFTVADVVHVGLTVIATPTRADRSHATIPELNSLDRRDPNKEMQMETWALALRDRARLIHVPG